jgi:VIT1/CCC1 family predicted Fe2+/Mn2+ transporter
LYQKLLDLIPSNHRGLFRRTEAVRKISVGYRLSSDDVRCVLKELKQSNMLEKKNKDVLVQTVGFKYGQKTTPSMEDLLERKLSKGYRANKAQANFVAAIVGLVVAIVVIVAVAIPVVTAVIANAGLTGTTATIVNLIPLFLGLVALVATVAYLTL